MAEALIKNWKILLLIFLLLGSFLVIGVNGLRFGIDFKGGTLFQIHLGKPVESSAEMSRITSTISQRLDWTGLKDTKVTSWGDEFVVAQIAKTDAETIQRIESLLKRQGRFEVTIDGNVIFTGEDIIEISKDPAKGYGLRKQQNLIMWILPFTLNNKAAVNFRDMTFHRCTIISYDPQAGAQYDCDRTYFFIDRPVNSILVYPLLLKELDREMLFEGSPVKNIPAETKLDELLENAAVPVIEADKNFSSEQLLELQSLKGKYDIAIVPDTLDSSLKRELENLGFKLKEFERTQTIPWIWEAVGIKQIISLSEDVTHMDVATKEQAEPLSGLIIRGFDPDVEYAQQSLSDLTVLLESGSLSVPVESISKETVSPLLGENFLFDAAVIGLVSLVVVSLVLFIRYRVIKLTIPIIFTCLSEVFLILGFASLIKWNLDLAAVAGILAVVGTGVDHQIIITDELMRGEAEIETSLVNRIRRAFFIIFAAATTTIATMFPIIFFSFGLGKIVGFAITTISGVLIGVFITRPAFGEIAKKILSGAA